MTEHDPAVPGAELPWPLEAAWSGADDLVWNDGAFNRALDFHGDPGRAGVVVFSDGNHHMALEQALRAYVEEFPQVGDAFYVTLPPAVLLALLDSGALRLGNLRLALQPHLFISPIDVLESLVERGRVSQVQAFASSRGCVLLVARGNPRGVHGLQDLFRDDVRLFISNPHRERASFGVYRDTLCALARNGGLDAGALAARLEQGHPHGVHGRRVHHREAPAALASGCADVAVVYHHLGLRYVRAFPDRFEMIALPGSGNVGPFPHHAVTTYGVGLVGDGGQWGAPLRRFLLTEPVAEIYRAHGLDAPATD